MVKPYKDYIYCFWKIKIFLIFSQKIHHYLFDFKDNFHTIFGKVSLALDGPQKPIGKSKICWYTPCGFRSKIICPDGGMVYTEVSKSSASRLAGSSPALGTINSSHWLFFREIWLSEWILLFWSIYTPRIIFEKD